MKREFISIPEIIIKNQNPQDIIIKAVRAIPRKLWNYSCGNDRFLQGRSYEKVTAADLFRSYTSDLQKRLFRNTATMIRLKSIRAVKLRTPTVAILLLLGSRPD